MKGYNCTIICDFLFLRLFKRFFILGLELEIVLGLGTGLALGLRAKNHLFFPSEV